MAISKKSGREYQSRRDRGYGPAKRRYKAQKYQKGLDRLGQPNTCGVLDPATGDECPRPIADTWARCAYHQSLWEQAQSAGPDLPSAGPAEEDVTE